MMDTQFTKIDENTLGVTPVKPEEILSQIIYDYSFLKQQLINIQAQKDRDNVLRDAEIVEVLKLLAQADRLGIIAKEIKIA